jgi:hypothetical protein
MSHHAQFEAVTATFLREEDELEGALLLPVATPIEPVIAEQPASMAAVPIGYFEYETAMVEEQQQEQIAYSIPQISSDSHNTAVSDDSRPRVRQAQQTGRIAAEEELEAIRRANRKVFAHGYHEQEALKKANDIARVRDRQGLHASSSPAHRFSGSCFA